MLCVFFFLFMASGAVFGYRTLRRQFLAHLRAAQQPEKKEFVVEHGKVADPADLHPRGKLYFVAVGRQAIPVSYFVDYYHKKFGIDITMLDPVQLPSSACVPKRNQCIAEEVMATMTNDYPEIARNPESVMIALTDEDIFPQALGWGFTYSLRDSRIGVVSTRRMDPAAWGDEENAASRLASTKQMLTKYIAIEYFGLPDSMDQSSILTSPLTPDGGSDDLYESDLHPEFTANGQKGSTVPCLNFTYSYKAHEMRAESPLLRDCIDHKAATSTDEEIFETQLDWGSLTQRSMDISLNSTPHIEFKRGYNSAVSAEATAMGWGADHSYNIGLTSDGLGALTFLHVDHEDRHYDLYDRVPAGRGFDPYAIYENHDYAVYGARLTYVLPHYKLQYRNGDASMFLACVNAGSHCYWYSFQDSKGNTLNAERGTGQEVRRVAASDGQALDFQSDDHQRIVQAVAPDGSGLAYDYDEDGCLARVRRSDGTMTLYGYDAAHRMTSVSVVRRQGAAPEGILANEYDPEGRVTKQTVLGLGEFKIEYLAMVDGLASEVRITTPDGEVFNILNDRKKNRYFVRSVNIRFPRKQP